MHNALILLNYPEEMIVLLNNKSHDQDFLLDFIDDIK